MRLVPGQSVEDMLTRLKGVLDEVAREVPASATIDVMQNVPALETAAGNALLEAVVDSAGQVLGSTPSVGGVSYGTDGAILAPALRASMVVFGPGKPEQAHQPNEYVELQELDQAVEAYKLIARRMVGPAA